jgi:hypothetical protein
MHHAKFPNSALSIDLEMIPLRLTKRRTYKRAIRDQHAFMADLIFPRLLAENPLFRVPLENPGSEQSWIAHPRIPAASQKH